jgi:competence protein ComEA
MFKKILVIALATLAFSAFAAVDINKATQAELEALPGIGTSMSTRILDERKKSAFKNWDDVTARVKGIKSGNAAKFSAAGMTVDGTPFGAASAKAAAPRAATQKAKTGG